MIDEQELLGMDDDELDEWWEEMQYYRAEAMTFQMLPSHEEQHADEKVESNEQDFQ